MQPLNSFFLLSILCNFFVPSHRHDRGSDELKQSSLSSGNAGSSQIILGYISSLLPGLWDICPSLPQSRIFTRLILKSVTMSQYLYSSHMPFLYGFKMLTLKRCSTTCLQQGKLPSLCLCWTETLFCLILIVSSNTQFYNNSIVC